MVTEGQEAKYLTFRVGTLETTVEHCMSDICVAAKNVAADIAAKLCESVATKLEGKVLGTFGSEFWFSLSSYIWKVWLLFFRLILRLSSQ